MRRGGAIDRFRASRRRRGAAVLMVVLILTMLMGVGVYAARSAVLSTAASGYERQATQTHYVTQYATISATAELSTARTAAYLKQMSSVPDPLCQSGLYVDSATKVPNYTCYRFGFGDLQAQLGSQVFLPANALGVAAVDGDWIVEMSDLTRSAPVAGMDLTSAGASNLEFMEVTLTSTGEVRPSSATSTTTADKKTGSLASVETSRAHLVVGPIPKL